MVEAPAVGDNGVSALEHQDDAVLGGEADSQFLAVGLHGGGVRADEPAELAGVRRQHGRPAAALQQAQQRRQGVEAVGVKNERQGRLFEDRPNDGGDAVAASEAGAESGGGVLTHQRDEFRNGAGGESAVVVFRQGHGHVTGIAGRGDGEDAGGQSEADESRAAAEGGGGAQDGGPGHAAAAGHEEDAAEVALVGVGVARRQAGDFGDDVGGHVHKRRRRGGQGEEGTRGQGESKVFRQRGRVRTETAVVSTPPLVPLSPLPLVPSSLRSLDRPPDPR